MRAPRNSIERAAETADRRWIVFPKYTASAPANLIPFPKAHAFMRSAQKAINYGLLGAPSFDLLADVIDRCACYEFGYGDLEEAIAVLMLGNEVELSNSRTVTACMMSSRGKSIVFGRFWHLPGYLFYSP